MSEEEKPLTEYKTSEVRKMGLDLLAELKLVQSNEYREELRDRALELLLRLADHSVAAKRRMRRLGQYRVTPPPIDPSEWNEESWHMWIDSQGEWLPAEENS